MKMNGKYGFAILLIAFGTLILIGKLGFVFGSLLGYLVPIAMVALGYIGIKNGSRFFGWVILIIGLIALMGKFAGVIGFIIAAGLIIYGFSLLRQPKVNR